MKKLKKKTKSQLTKKADEEFSKYWRKKIGKCELCGRTEQLQLAHIISRDCRKLRYEPKNKFILCYSCHFTFHRKPLIFAEFVKKKKGEAVYKWLIRESNKLVALTNDFYEKVITKYSSKDEQEQNAEKVLLPDDRKTKEETKKTLGKLVSKKQGKSG